MVSGQSYRDGRVMGYKKTVSVDMSNISTGQYLQLSGSNFIGNTPTGGGAAFPIGSIFMAVVSTNPATLLGYGTWVAFGAGRMLIGHNAGDPDFDTVEETGGAKTSAAILAHTHPITDPGHNHTQNSHNHTQNSHNHTQDSHLHTIGTGTTDGTPGIDSATTSSTLRNTGSTTATNQATTATNQAATATNNSNTTGITGTASAGSGTSFPIMNPYIVVYLWKRTA
jgi:hypothetical protein